MLFIYLHATVSQVDTSQILVFHTYLPTYPRTYLTPTILIASPSFYTESNASRNTKRAFQNLNPVLSVIITARKVAIPPKQPPVFIPQAEAQRHRTPLPHRLQLQLPGPLPENRLCDHRAGSALLLVSGSVCTHQAPRPCMRAHAESLDLTLCVPGCDSRVQI